MEKVLVVGGGASGMMAAAVAAERGFDVVLVEKNKILGKKLLITGKGRCNLTNACESVEELIENVTKNSSFLYSAFYTFTNFDTMKFFENLGVKLKVERGKRVFPVSDKSFEIQEALIKYMKKNGVKIINDTVDEISVSDGEIKGAVLSKRGFIACDKLILATGGLSYQNTGSTGDGYWWAEDMGHTVVEPTASLVPLKTVETWPQSLQGLSLKNIAVTVCNEKNKKVYEDFGEMMFAHFGITGPVILSASAHLRPMDKGKYTLYVDLKPALDEKQLDQRLLRDFEKNINKSIYNCLRELLPVKMIEIFLDICDIEAVKKVNLITKEERKKIISNLKKLKININMLL